jgi:hypothetical protein
MNRTFFLVKLNSFILSVGQIQSLPEKTPRELAQTAYYLATKRW